MSKCEHHDELKEQMDRVERSLDEKIRNSDRNVHTAFLKIDKLRCDFETQVQNNRETETYVKTLYARFDELAKQMSNMVTKLDAYIQTIAILQQKAENISSFQSRGKDLIFEIIKWLLLVLAGTVIAKNTL